MTWYPCVTPSHLHQIFASHHYLCFIYITYYMTIIATAHCNTYMHLKQPNSDLEFQEKNIQKLSVMV